MLDRAAKEAAEHGRDARLRDVVGSLHEDVARAEVAFVLAAAIAFADSAIADEENETLNLLAEGLGISEARADELLDSVESDLAERRDRPSSAPASSRLLSLGRDVDQSSNLKRSSRSPFVSFFAPPTSSRQHRADELALLLGELEDLLLDGPLRDEPVRRDDLRLPDAVGAVGRLVLDRGVPPRVEVDDRVRRGQVQAAAARLERDEEDRGPVLAPGSSRRSSARSLVDPSRYSYVDAVLVHRALDDLQHADELAEDEHPVAALDATSATRSRSATSLPESSSPNSRGSPSSRGSHAACRSRVRPARIWMWLRASPWRSTSPMTCARTSLSTAA